MSEFKINRSQGKCSVTGRAFTDGEKFIVALRPEGDQEGVFQRVDIGMEAWERQGGGGYTAWWPSQYSSARKPALMDPDALWQVFHRARAEQQPEGNVFSADELNQFAYVAALGLMRLRKLKLKGTRRAGKKEYLVFDTPGKAKDRASYEVLNLALDEKGVEQVQDKLADLA